MKSPKEPITLEQILADLVAFQTVTGEYEAASSCLDYIEAYLTERGMKVERKEHNHFPVLLAATHNAKRPKVLLQAHIDVVSAPDKCYRMHESNGKLYGRGVYDMKFAVAVFLKVVDELKDRLFDYDFGIMLTSDEEVGGKDGVKVLLDAGYSAGVCLLPDAGDNWHIETGYKGYWRVCATTTGIAAHGSRPWEGDNAIDRLIDAIYEIRALFEKQSPDNNTLSVNKILGGTAANQVADKAQAWLDLRFINKRNHERLRKEIETVAGQYGVALETVAEMEASKRDNSHPLIVSFLDIAKRLHGKPLESIYSLGGSDARYFSKHGIPVILVRPAGGSAHGNGEWIDKKGLEKYYRVIKAYVEETCLIDSSSR